jgi:hypothetical protein
MKLTLSKRQQWSVSSIPFSLLDRYLRLLMWLNGVSTYLISYNVFVKRIKSLWTLNGPAYLVLYLKGCYLITQHYIAGKPTRSETIRIGLKHGLPIILPGPLRHFIMAGETSHIRVILGLFSLFRVIKFKGILKLNTITDPFSGIEETLSPAKLGYVFSMYFKPRFNEIPFPKGMKDLLILKSAGPNHSTSILGAAIDSLCFKANPELAQALITISDYFKSDIAEMLMLEMNVAARVLDPCEGILGRLAIKEEAAGKLRVFAMADVWTQSVLVPIHDYIFRFLETIKQDGTHDQVKPLHLLLERVKLSGKTCYSFDLSAATDRLPIKLQVQILSQLFTRELAEAWAKLLVGREWHLKSNTYGNATVKYSVGQPMGALSSWAMLALTHHFIVQYAANMLNSGPDKGIWFEDYAILGDDIVIADDAVAKVYLSIMEDLGVEINLSKSLVSDKGVMEFAKRLISPLAEYSPIGPKNILWCLKTPSMIPSVFMDMKGKGYKLDANFIEQQWNSISSVVRLSRRSLEVLKWTVSGPFGLVKGVGLAPTEVANRLNAFSPYTIISSIKTAMLQLSEKEHRVATEKTLLSLVELTRWSQGHGNNFLLPSRRSLVLSGYAMYFDLLDADPNPKFPTGSRTSWGVSSSFISQSTLDPEEEIVALLKAKPEFSPLTNMLVKAKVPYPRLRPVTTEFMSKVQRLSKGRHAVNKTTMNSSYARAYMQQIIPEQEYVF